MIKVWDGGVLDTCFRSVALSDISAWSSGVPRAPRALPNDWGGPTDLPDSRAWLCFAKYPLIIGRSFGPTGGPLRTHCKPTGVVLQWLEQSSWPRSGQYAWRRNARVGQSLPSEARASPLHASRLASSCRGSGRAYRALARVDLSNHPPMTYLERRALSDDETKATP